MIGITGRRSPRSDAVRGPAIAAGERYCDAVTRAGGTPVIIGPGQSTQSIRRLAEELDGIVFTGGGDLDPANYGGDSTDARLYGVNPSLDQFETNLLKEAIDSDIPVLAICRGMQLLNVSLGGSLYIDLEDVDSRTTPHWDSLHDVRLSEGCRLSPVFGPVARDCHSFHHQSVRAVGSGLRVVGSSSDGMIEAIEHETCRWVVGIQWHPEDTSHHDVEQQRLFDEFVRATRDRTRLL